MWMRKVTIQRAVDSFIFSKRIYCADRTIDYYSDRIDLFIKWLQSEKNIKMTDDIKTLDKKLLQEYILFYNMSSVRKSTLWNYVIAVKTFYKWLFYENYIPEDCTINLKLPRMTRKNIIPLSAVEVQQIDSCFEHDEMGLRDKLAFHLMLDCGLRSQEVLHLKNSDINIHESYLNIQNTKFNKNRVVSLPNKLKDLIFLYRDDMEVLKSDTLLLNRYRDGPMTENALKKVMYKLKKRSGVGRVHAHLLRHTFATSFIMGGGNLEMLRILLGHADYNVTKDYLHIATQSQLMHYDIYKLDECFFQTYRNYHEKE